MAHPEPAVFFGMKTQLLVEAPKASEAVKFYKAAFGAEEFARTTQTKRKADQELPHISFQLILAGSTIVVADAGEHDASWAFAGTGVALKLETDDVLTAARRPWRRVADSVGAISEDDSGCIVGRVKDPYGYLWIISSSPAEEPAADCVVVELGWLRSMDFVKDISFLTHYEIIRTSLI